MESKSFNSVFDRMQTASQVVDTANRKIDEAMRGLRKSYITRWSVLNAVIDSIQEEELIVIGARPGMGKSAFANLLIRDIFNSYMNPYDTIGLYFSLEMPSYQQVVRWYSNEVKLESKKMLSSRNPIDDEKFNQIKTVGESLRDLPIWFWDIPLNPRTVGNTALDVYRRFPNKQVFVFLDHTRLVTGGDDERKRIELLLEIAHKLKTVYGIIVIFLSQMNRDIEKERNRKEMGTSLPVMADLFAASAIEQYATTILMLHRPEVYGVKGEFKGMDVKNTLYVNITKQRDGKIGVIGLKTEFQHYDIHDGNRVMVDENGEVILHFTT